MPDTTPELAAYDESEREAFALLAEILHGDIIDLAGGLAGIRFAGSYDRPHTPENDDEPFDGWYLAGLDDDGGPWIITYEHRGDTGQREWVDVKLPDHWRAFPDQVRAAFLAAGNIASQGPQL